jgi:hypothetical protein
MPVRVFRLCTLLSNIGSGNLSSDRYRQSTEPVEVKGTPPISKNRKDNELSYAPTDKFVEPRGWGCLIPTSSVR